MLCRTCTFSFRKQFISLSFLSKNLSEQSSRKDERDPADYFFDKKVQNLMKNLTRMDLAKVFQPRKEEQKIETPEYKFMTSEQLEKEMVVIRQKAEMRLQMPPVVKERDEIDCVLADDKQLMGHSTSKFVFTDITYGISDRDRIIVVRDEDGVLRKANWEERGRMNQIYFERTGRKLVKPKMFEEENLQDILKRGEYIFILDRACAQFEPDDPDFIRVQAATYDHVNEVKAFNKLRSTRHFGPLSFYLAWKKRIDDLLIDVINSDRLDEALSLIELFHLLHPNSKSINIDKNQGDIEIIKEYAKLDSSKQQDIELAVQNYSRRQFDNIQSGEQEAQAN